MSVEPVAVRMTRELGYDRELPQLEDLATIVIAHAMWPSWDSASGAPPEVVTFHERLRERTLQRVEGDPESLRTFAVELERLLRVFTAAKGGGTSFRPFHPALLRSPNAEWRRMRQVGEQIASTLPVGARERLRELWSVDRMTPFERLLHAVVDNNLGEGFTMPAVVGEADPAETRFAVCADDVAALLKVPLPINTFLHEFRRLLIFHVALDARHRAVSAQALPFYAAPAASDDEKIKRLAHELLHADRRAIERHGRTRFLETLRGAADEIYQAEGLDPDPSDAHGAFELARILFGPRSTRFFRSEDYPARYEEHGSFAEAAYHYYSAHSGARDRFLRRQHASFLTLGKKAGIMASRSTVWHYGWLAEELVETLLLVESGRAAARERILVADLLERWRSRYRIALGFTPDERETIVQRHSWARGGLDGFARRNRVRLLDAFAARGRLEKASDSHPYVRLER